MTSYRFFLPTLLCCALAVPGSAYAQNRTNGDDLVSMDFQNAELEDVIKLVAEYTGKNFLYDDRVRGQVTVLSGSMLTPEEAYTVFESILQVKGFTTVDGRAGVVKILPIREAKETALQTVTGPGREPNRDLYITRLVPLRYVKADTIVNTFRPLVSKDANIIAYAPTNTMIVTDTSANIRRLMTILSEIDVQTYQDKIKLIPIEYADAEQVTTHLQAIFSDGTGSSAASGRRRTSRARTQRTGSNATAAAAEGNGVIGVAGEPRFITDERTNSIVVIAPSSTIVQVEKLIALLDFKRKGTGRIHVYRLQNADSEEMAETLSSLTQSSGGSRRSSSGGAGGGAAAAAAAAVAELEGDITITADAPTNSLIIQASAEGFAALRDVIEQLDTRRPQVLVEALIMEVLVDGNESLGGGLLFNAAPSDELAFQVGSNTGSTGIGGIPPGVITDPGSFTSQVIGNTVSIDLDGDGAIDPTSEVFPVIQGIITATAGQTDTNIIASPSLLTADNEEAQIIIGQNIPVPTSNLARDTGSDTGNFTTSQNIERQDVGVTLRVTPQISEGDSVRLEIFQEISEVVTAGSQENLGPTTSNRQVENTVFVSNGESVMIGGILQETQSAVQTKVPFLGDIPILGWAFKSTTDTVRKTNLLVVLTPHIVREPEDLAMLTVQKRERFHTAAGDGMNLTEKEKQARQEALEAGIELPADSNPVRRALEEHREQYPTREFPLLEERQDQRESARRKAIEEVGKRLGGAYVVQVAPHLVAGDATSMLESLIRNGFDGTVLSKQEGDQVLHTVQLGPFLSADKALQVAREVRIESGRSTAVVVEP